MEMRECEVVAVGHANQKRGAVVWSCCVKSNTVGGICRDNALITMVSCERQIDASSQRP